MVVVPEEARASRLVAYLIPLNEEAPSADDLKPFLHSQLPDYMLPSLFITVDAFPLTPSGKVDRRALARMEVAAPEFGPEYVPPRTELEKLLAQVWREVLRTEQIGIHDSFFELGGDSILSIQVISKALAVGIRLEPMHIFQHPTIAELAEISQASRIHAEQGLVEGAAPLTPWQQQLIERASQPSLRSRALLLELAQAPSLAALERAVQEIVRHHDALRLHFEKETEGWVQYNGGDGRMAVFSSIDLSDLPSAEQAQAMTEHITALRAELDLTAGPLFRVVYFHLGPDRSPHLLFLAHDLVVDSQSWPLMLQDFLAVMAMLERGGPVQLPPKTTAFIHWAQRLQEYAQSEAVQEDLPYWLDALSAQFVPPPVDPDADGETDVAAIMRELSEDETAALLDEAMLAYHTEPRDLLLTALHQAVVRHGDDLALLVDIESDVRMQSIAEDVDASRTAGRFTATYPVALSLPADEHPGEAIKSIKEQLRSIPHGGLSYGLLRYLHEDEAIRTHLRSLPRPPFSFRLTQSPAEWIAGLPAIRIAPESTGAERNPGDGPSSAVELEAVVQDGRMRLRWQCDPRRYSSSTLAALADEFMAALRALIEHCLSPDAGGFTQSDVADFGWDESDLQDFEDILSRLDDM